jgi:hypothetical protein
MPFCEDPCPSRHVGSSVKMSPLALGTAAAAAARPIGARFTQAMRLCTSAEPTLRKGFNLFEVLGRLPSQGAGARVYRRTWEEKGYSPETHHWLVTRSMLRMVRPARPPHSLMEPHGCCPLPHRKGSLSEERCGES